MLGAMAQHVLEASARNRELSGHRIHADEVAVDHDEAQVRIEQGEAFVDALDRVAHARLGVLQGRDVGPDAEVSAVGGSPLVHAIPLSVCRLLLGRLIGGIAMPLDPLLDPFFAVEQRRDRRHVVIGESPHDLFESKAARLGEEPGRALVHEALVVVDEAILRVEQGEAVGHGIDRRQQSLLRDLDRRDVGPDADIAAVFGPALRHALPPAVTELHLERFASRRFGGAPPGP